MSAGRLAVVTGSTQGLGQAMASSLLDGGHRVVICGRARSRAEQVAYQLDPSRTRAFGHGLRADSRSSFVELIEDIEQEHGPISIWVNNAGMTPTTAFLEVSDEEFDEVIAVNLRSVFIACQLIAPRMAQRGWGRIINHASLAGQQGGLVAGPHYAASKAGIIVLTKIVAVQFASDGVTVNAISPAAIDSPPMHQLPAPQQAELPGRIPVGRVGRPEEVAALVSFLASDDAAYITGTTVDINGGLFMR